jgi:hypothetical protein
MCTGLSRSREIPQGPLKTKPCETKIAQGPYKPKPCEASCRLVGWDLPMRQTSTLISFICCDGGQVTETSRNPQLLFPTAPNLAQITCITGPCPQHRNQPLRPAQFHHRFHERNLRPQNSTSRNCKLYPQNNKTYTSSTSFRLSPNMSSPSSLTTVRRSNYTSSVNLCRSST